MNQCLKCNNYTTNPKFCSRKCSTSFNNKVKPKRVKTKQCKTCCRKIRIKSKYCSDCFITSRIDNKTIGELRLKNGQHPSWRWGSIREHCRRVNAFREKVCQVCGYSKHVEYAHIKPLSSFRDDDRISVINDPSNVLILCRNHHWEFDHGILII